jgi:hypothetical protein
MKRVVSVAFVVAAVAGCDDPTPLAKPPGSVSGQICNPLSEQIVAGATVTITWTEGDIEKTKSVVTDDNGEFSLEGVGEGAQTLVVTSEAFEAAYPVIIPSGDTLLYVDEACRDRPQDPGTGTLVGEICNRHTGEVVTDATVSVTLADGSTVTTTTDPTTGNFELTGVPAGTVTVVVSSPGYSRSYVVELGDGDTVVVEQSSDCGIPDPLSTGFVVGNVCAPGTTNEPLEGAAVTARYTGADGVTYVDGPFYSLADGSFIVDPIGPTPATNVVIRAEKDGFAYSWNVPTVANRVDDLDGIQLTAQGTCEPLVTDTDQRYLVVTGQFDRIQDVLERMELDNVTLHDGNPASSVWAEDLFATRDYINTFDAIFINCGVSEAEIAAGLSPNALNNIRNYVAQGGALYVSDWAYGVVEQAFPDKLNFYGDDTRNDTAEVAIGGQYVATVIDEGLRERVGAPSFTIDISFQLGTVIQEVAPDVTIYLETDMQYRREVGGDVIADIIRDTPVTVGFKHGVGTVIYTSFHQEEDEELDGPEDEMLRYLVFEL